MSREMTRTELQEHADKLWRAEKCPWCTGQLYKVSESNGTTGPEYLCLDNCSMTL